MPTPQGYSIASGTLDLNSLLDLDTGYAYCAVENVTVFDDIERTVKSNSSSLARFATNPVFFDYDATKLSLNLEYSYSVKNFPRWTTYFRAYSSTARLDFSI